MFANYKGKLCDISQRISDVYEEAGFSQTYVYEWTRNGFFTVLTRIGKTVHGVETH